MATANDVEDLVTCGVCLCEYDDVNRKPKFLQCSHTVCFSCLKEIRRDDLITCPFCRDTFVKFDIASLPNNSYALHMIKFKEKQEPKPVEIVTAPLEVHWCLTCGSAEKLGCSSSGHSSVNMSVSTIKNLEALLILKEELLKMKDTGTNKLAMAIQERQKVQEQLALIMKSIQCSEQEIKQLQDENNLRMTEIVSILERNELKTVADSQQDVSAKKELFFSELMSLVDGSTADDTTETLKLKMTKLVENYEQKLSEASSIASEYEFRKKVKITVHLYDEKDQPIPTLPMLEEGFRFQPLSPALKGSQIRQDSTLLSYAVFSLLQRQKMPLKMGGPSQQPVDASLPTAVKGKDPKNKKQKVTTKKEKQEKKTKPPPPSVFPSKSQFVLSQSTVFILRLFQSGCPKGEIRFLPIFRLPWITEFMQKLGEFCFKSQKFFCNTIDKVLPGVFLFSNSNQQFQPEISNPIGTRENKPSYDLIADKVDEIGITLVKTSSGKITGWSFVFPLQEFGNPKNQVHVKKVLANEFVGRVMNHHMLESISKLGLTTKSERTNYTITLEAQ